MKTRNKVAVLVVTTDKGGNRIVDGEAWKRYLAQWKSEKVPIRDWIASTSSHGLAT